MNNIEIKENQNEKTVNLALEQFFSEIMQYIQVK